MTVTDQPEVRPYGKWQSPMSVETIFSQSAAPTYPFRWQRDLFWLQSLPDEGGRIALMRWSDSDSAEPICLTPPSFNVRSQVHEYGGCCFCVQGNDFIFNNFSDGRLYRQSLSGEGEPVALTPEDSSCVGFADVKVIAGSTRLVAVIERTTNAAENINALAVVDPDHTQTPVYEIVSGCDFYACPTVSSKGDALAWFEWNHPGMPWDQTRVCSGKLIEIVENGSNRLVCNTMQRLMDAPNCAANQTGFLASGGLVYACDSSEFNWSGLYLWNQPDSIKLTNIKMEFGEAHWVFGQRRWIEVGEGIIFAIATAEDGDILYKFAVNTPDQIEEVLRDASISQISYTGGRLQMVVAPENQLAKIMEIDPDTAECRYVGPLGNVKDAIDCSMPVSFSCKTRDGEQTFGYLYRPCNPAFVAPENTRPPLVVMVHGGPTSRTNKCYQPLRQYFASIGFAVLDINHRGSTGYGRAYRQRLLGQWGEVDAMDIADAINYLAKQGEIDEKAVFIRGGSAGGYAVLRALTVYPTLFAGGACYYGIGNLITLSEFTHKFESRYTDMLVGETFNPEGARLPRSRYRSRSPIFHMDQLQAPVIFFQGLLDRVVPPEVTREVVELLVSRNIPHSYTEYDNEGHGFRNTENRIDSLQREIGFFIDILEQYST